MRKLLYAFALLVTAPLPAFAQQGWVFSLTERADNIKPAQVSYIKPEGESSSYLIKAAATATTPGFKLFGDSVWQARFGPGFAKNTLVTKRQDNIGFSGVLLGSVDVAEFFTLLPWTTLAYENNRVADTDSLRVILDTGFVSTPLKLGGYFEVVKGIDFRWVPRLGFYHDRVISSTTDPERRSTGVVGKIYVEIIPIALDEKLALTADYQYLRELTASDDSKKTHIYREIGIEWKFYNPTDNAVRFKPSVGFTWVNGADPFQGLEEQKYRQLILKLKY
jgi:hypothetical protein